MRDLNVLPQKRDKEAKIGYKFLDWFYRSHRKKLRKAMKSMMLEKILYGGEKRWIN